MTRPEVAIRALRSGEWRAWRTLRLRAVADAPDSFETTFEEEAAQPDRYWKDIIESCIDHERCELWFAELAGEHIGMGFATVDEAVDVVSVGAMWVAPEARGLGIGRGLLETAIAWGRTAGADRARLWVTVGNDTAEQLYASAGFVTEIERKPLRPTSDRKIRLLEHTIRSSEADAPSA